MIIKKRIYLDYAATTPVDPAVVKVMLPYFTKKYGNTASLHSFGQEASQALEKSRNVFASLLNADKREIIFTGSATESNNFVLKGITAANLSKGKHLIVSSVEHDCILESARHLERNGFSVTYLPVDRFGLVSPSSVKEALRPDTVLVSIMHANNEIGTINPVGEIGALCKKNNILFHTDASQTFGKIKINVKEMNINLLTASSHKIYGPKGAALLYIKNSISLVPIIHGGGHERGLRSSTVNLPAIVGFTKATTLAYTKMTPENFRLQKLRDELIKGVLASIPTASLNGHPTLRLSNNANFSFSGIEGESIVSLLDDFGIAASTGSACSSPKLEPSHVLTACNVAPQNIHGSLRLSLGRWTKKSDIDYILKILPKVITKLNKISPFT